ncbi:MAG: hypothetical protein AB1695_12390 [Stygiobacter sp.]|jgi:hypothetical protein|uniref:Uncharacterized protein n=1 Tax=Stygiobacter electus TaxID=3032292 RepID=A0AAE3NZM5_9BACT|nr:hypothetical protein [Stygiobacter electus]MDF1611654.1 hypothetical protein [Stygiobacter electus]
MEQEKKNEKLDTIGFYFLLGILGLSLLFLFGYIIYSSIFG